MDIRDYIKTSIEMDRIRLEHNAKIANAPVEGVIKSKRAKGSGKKEYYLRLPGDERYRYAGEKYHKQILLIKSKKLAEGYVKALKYNIDCKECFLNSLVSDAHEDIVGQLPLAYRPDPEISGEVGQKKRNRKVRQSENPYKREGLVIETSFGLFVRTKGELVIAELLYSLEIPFYYEKALTLTAQRSDEVGVPYTSQKTYYPDFTIEPNRLFPIYWEHKGLMKYSEYVARDMQKEIDYNANGIYQSHNLIVTAEGPNNQMDMDGIMRIVTGWLMPVLGL